jgi:glycosyltransferase involved in cell wall biosynthesis
MIFALLNLFLLLIVIINALTMPKLSRKSASSASIAIHIPLRNESENIVELIEMLKNQSYGGDYHFYLLDDNSTDDTYALLEKSIGIDDRFTLLNGSELPAGWIGKTWALEQLFQTSKEEIIISLDADVRITSDAFSRAVSTLDTYKLDFLSVYPRQIVTSFGQRMVQPLLQWSWLSTLILRITIRFSNPAFAVANGQFFMVRRSAMPGYHDVANKVLDDMELARVLLKSGHKGSVVNGGEIAQCHMYSSFTELRAGYAKSLWKAFGSIGGTILAIAFILATGVLPIILILMGSLWGWIALELIVLSRIISASLSNGRIIDSIMHPLSSIMLVYLIIYSWSVRKSVQWKGRTL